MSCETCRLVDDITVECVGPACDVDSGAAATAEYAGIAGGRIGIAGIADEGAGAGAVDVDENTAGSGNAAEEAFDDFAESPLSSLSSFMKSANSLSI